MRSFKIAPSILSGDFARLGEECKELTEAGADWLHIDIMDGHFVPNLTMGPPVVKSLRRHMEGAFLDCHCMVSDPEKWIDDLAKAGANQMTFHLEATSDAELTIELVKKSGMRVGVAVKPATPVDSLLPLLDVIDMVLVMTVEPGFGGQAFLSECLDKVRKVHSLVPSLDIQVDGGINLNTLPLAVEAGANVIVAGTLVFAAPNKREIIAQMKQRVGSSASS